MDVGQKMDVLAVISHWLLVEALDTERDESQSQGQERETVRLKVKQEESRTGGASHSQQERQNQYYDSHVGDARWLSWAGVLRPMQQFQIYIPIGVWIPPSARGLSPYFALGRTGTCFGSADQPQTKI